jgi:hypothetical protein
MRPLMATSRIDPSGEAAVAVPRDQSANDWDCYSAAVINIVRGRQMPQCFDTLRREFQVPATLQHTSLQPNRIMNVSSPHRL